MKIPRLFVPSLILAATLLGCETMPTQEKTTSGTVPLQPIKVAENKAEIEALVEKAEKGDVIAQHNLGLMYDNGRGVTKDEVEAVKWYRKAADQGFAKAQFNLGNMYDNGLGVAKDEVEAYKWSLLSGAQGNELARKRIPLIEGNLTPSQRAEGQKLAREFKKK